jgi:methylmalonyl-CoA epimerase
MSAMLLGIDHVGLAVRDLDAAADRYLRALGMTAGHRETVEAQGVEAVFLDTGDPSSSVELLAPLRPDSAVGRFLESRGEGLHHVAYRVDDIAAALEALRAEGIPLVDEQPREGSRGTLIAFAHPRGFAGTLVELVQHPEASR